jgi:NAD(P)-dependent dehydrogenase (short-subunit alcohol dehydrogenase family)
MSRTAIITGGGRGIGRATALALAADGWRVAIAGRSTATLEETAAAIEATGGAVVAVPADVGDPAQVDALFATVVERFGRVDLLFNNAGIAAPAVPIDELDPEVWDDVVAANLTGSFLCARAAFAQMRRQEPGGGRIINNGSVSAETPRPFSAPYTATKHAITGLTKALSLDGRELGIACSQIDFGNISSDMGDQMAAGVLQPDGSTRPEPTIPVANAVDAIRLLADLPLEANVLRMTLMANGMPFVGRG